MVENLLAVGMVDTIPDGRSVFRPIWRFFIHPTSDIAFGVPHELIEDATGKGVRSKVLSLDIKCPEIGSVISTWSYPLHADIGGCLHLQPDFYDGTLQDIFTTTGPSAKLCPPYYLTSIHLYGGSSGGPVFGADGHVFGIASCSYDGAENIAYVTPVSTILEIELQQTTYHTYDGGSQSIDTVKGLATIGALTLRSKP